MNNEYICYICKRTFTTDGDWSDEEAIAEFRRNFPASELEDTIICEECYKSFG